MSSRSSNTKPTSAITRTARLKSCPCNDDPIGDAYRRDLAAAQEELFLCAEILAEGNRELTPRRRPVRTLQQQQQLTSDDLTSTSDSDSDDESYEDLQNHDHDSNESIMTDQMDKDESDHKVPSQENYQQQQQVKLHFQPKRRPTIPPSSAIQPLGKPKDPPVHVYLLRMWLHSEDMADYVRQMEDFIDIMDDALHWHNVDRMKRAEEVQEAERRYQHELEMVKARAMFSFPGSGSGSGQDSSCQP
ncbi:hypothetical protein FBU30_001721 [Linnemannia zychae]|nr:hypothetical protein FBU30_001721 [Linnemannia zychae]